MSPSRKGNPQREVCWLLAPGWHSPVVFPREPAPREVHTYRQAVSVSIALGWTAHHCDRVGLVPTGNGLIISLTQNTHHAAYNFSQCVWYCHRNHWKLPQNHWSQMKFKKMNKTHWNLEKNVGHFGDTFCILMQILTEVGSWGSIANYIIAWHRWISSSTYMCHYTSMAHRNAMNPAQVDSAVNTSIDWVWY